MTLRQRTIAALDSAGFWFVTRELKNGEPVKWANIARLLRWARKHDLRNRGKIGRALKRVEEIMKEEAKP